MLGNRTKGVYNTVAQGFPSGSAGKESTCNAGDLGLIPGLGRSPQEGKSYPLQYSGLENSRDCIVHGVTKSRMRLGDLPFHWPSKTSVLTRRGGEDTETEGRPRGDTESRRPSTSWAGGLRTSSSPQKKPSLLSPWSQTSGLQKARSKCLLFERPRLRYFGSET